MLHSRYVHFVRISAMQGEFMLGKQNKRNSHFLGLQTDLSRSVLLFECELRFFAYRYFAIAESLVL